MSSERVDKFRRRGSRYKARRRAVDILFEAEARDLDPVAVVEDRVELARDRENQVAPVSEYTRQIVAGVAEELDGVDDAIERYLVEDWDFERIPAVDRAILRMAVWELLFNEDVPVPAAVAQGVELASEYSTDAAGPYINALLDDVAHNREELRAAAAAGTAPADAAAADEAADEDAAPADADAAGDPDVADETADGETVGGAGDAKTGETTGPFGEVRMDTGIEAVGVEGVEPHHAGSAYPCSGQATGVNAAAPAGEEHEPGTVH